MLYNPWIFEEDPYIDGKEAEEIRDHRAEAIWESARDREETHNGYQS